MAQAKENTTASATERRPQGPGADARAQQRARRPLYKRPRRPQPQQKGSAAVPIEEV